MAVDAATSEVNRASQILVSVAQKVQDQHPEPDLKKIGTPGNADIFDQQALVLRLEKQVEDSRKRLGAMRQEQYEKKSSGGSISPRPAPQHPPTFHAPNASIDVSSISAFGTNESSETKVPSYQSKLEASLTRNMNFSLTPTQPSTQNAQVQPQVQQSQHKPFW